VDVCEKHGRAAHAVSHGKCLACYTLAGVLRAPLRPSSPDWPPARALAKEADERTFHGHCETHGPVAFWTHTGRCVGCYTTASKPRRPQGPSSARAAARRAGLKQYEGRCRVHGVVPHSVGPGKCLTCFNAMGYPRPGA
jgi:hypothetical protein